MSPTVREALCQRICYKRHMGARKYRQRGYMDEAEPERKERSSRPRQRDGRPRGRGLGAPTATVFRCARCGHKQTLTSPVAADATCPECAQDLHTCTNCIHFDSSAQNECRESVPERIAKKAARNECDLFAPKMVQEFERDSGKPDDPKAAFDSLFDI